MEMELIKGTYERLIPAHNKSKDDETIQPDILESKAFQEQYCCEDKIYLEQINNVVASKPEIIAPNTVGSYLYGCFQPELAIEIACTPECATGLKNPKLDACDIASYHKKGTLTKVNMVNSEEANIFIAHGEILTLEDKNLLLSHGIKVIKI
jgi:hypothetical protein